MEKPSNEILNNAKEERLLHIIKQYDYKYAVGDSVFVLHVKKDKLEIKRAVIISRYSATVDLSEYGKFENVDFYYVSNLEKPVLRYQLYAYMELAEEESEYLDQNPDVKSEVIESIKAFRNYIHNLPTEFRLNKSCIDQLITVTSLNKHTGERVGGAYRYKISFYRNEEGKSIVETRISVSPEHPDKLDILNDALTMLSNIKKDSYGVIVISKHESNLFDAMITYRPCDFKKSVKTKILTPGDTMIAIEKYGNNEYEALRNIHLITDFLKDIIVDVIDN